MDTCTCGLKRGASNSAETIPTNQPTNGYFHFSIAFDWLLSMSQHAHDRNVTQVCITKPNRICVSEISIQTNANL